MIRRLGKNPAKKDPRTLRLARYLRAELPAPPSLVDWTAGITYGMLGNDVVGDCAIAGPDHLMQTWTGDNGSECPITDAQALADYSAISGYDPSQSDASGNNPTDTGCNLLDVLKQWKNAGLAGRKIAAFAAVEPSNGLETMQAAWLFGGLLIGIQLPQSAMDQTDSSEPWFVVPGSPNLGGHCVCAVGYDADGLTCITWGQPQRMDWNFFHTLADEAWACLSQDWIGRLKIAPSGLDLSALMTDLSVLSA